MLIQYLIFVRSQMINQEDYTMIADYDCMGVDERGKILEQKGDQVPPWSIKIDCKGTQDQATVM